MTSAPAFTSKDTASTPEPFRTTSKSTVSGMDDIGLWSLTLAPAATRTSNSCGRSVRTGTGIKPQASSFRHAMEGGISKRCAEKRIERFLICSVGDRVLDLNYGAVVDQVKKVRGVSPLKANDSNCMVAPTKLQSKKG